MSQVPRSYFGLWLIVLLLFSVVYSISYSKNEVLLLATTTSVDNSGLLEHVLDAYLKDKPHLLVRVIAKGTGVALQLAKDGQVDAVIVHAEQQEISFIDEGYGINRTTLWYNYFVIIGPKDDPAGVSESSTILDAFYRIYQTQSPFISRGDESGTHQREKQIWDLLGLSPYDQYWYLETGSGMAHTLVTANQLNAYTLSDLGTYVQLKKNVGLQLEQLYSKEEPLSYNPYSYIITNPERFPERNVERAKDLLVFLIRNPELVSGYQVDGIVLFRPLGE